MTLEIDPCFVCGNNDLFFSTDEKQETEEEQKGEEENEEEGVEDPMDAFYPQALAGFIMVMTEEGDLIYLTENVNRHIGITQVQPERSLQNGTDIMKSRQNNNEVDKT